MRRGEPKFVFPVVFFLFDPDRSTRAADFTDLTLLASAAVSA